MIYVRPKKGLKVRNPLNRASHIPEDGCFIENSKDIQRLIMSGDLIKDETKKDPNLNSAGKPKVSKEE